VTLEIDQLHRQSLKTKGEETASLQALLKSKKKHYAVLEELQSFRSQTELRIRKIASDLGATQAEMLLVTARGNFNDNRFQRLDESLQDNLNGLRDIMAAMDEMGYSSAASY
jgi:seryl-tRNA synthetase